MTSDELRTERNSRLAETDFYMLVDVFAGLSTGDAEVVRLYRQALRDLPSRYADGETIEEVEWPAQPFTSED